MAPTPGPFDLNIAAPVPLRAKICYKSLIFVYRKSILITAKPDNLAF